MITAVSEEMIAYVERVNPNDVDYFQVAFARRFPTASLVERNDAVKEAAYRCRERGEEELWQARMLRWLWKALRYP